MNMQDDDIRAEALDYEEFVEINELCRTDDRRGILRMIAAILIAAATLMLGGCATCSGYQQTTSASYGPNGYTQSVQSCSQQSGVDTFAQGLALITPYVMPFVYGAAY